MSNAQRWLKTIAVGGALAVVAAVAGLLWFRYAPRLTPAGQPPLVRLDSSSLDGFRATFNASPDETRILVLLSPT